MYCAKATSVNKIEGGSPYSCYIKGEFDSRVLIWGHKMRKISLLSISCAVLAISACDHYSEDLAALKAPQPSIQQQSVSEISPAAGGTMGEMSFSGYLQSEYTQLARYEQSLYDYKAANYYTKKAKSLAEGTLVAPGSIREFSIQGDQKEELVRAREDLINALKTYNTPDNRYSLAMAQTRYDCWLEQVEESQNDEVITCKNEFRHSMASLIAPEGMDMRYAIPFEAGSMSLSEEARISLERALSFWKTNHERGYKLMLMPTAGMSAEESERQISMIRSILQFNGVEASDISVGTEGGSEQFEILIQQELKDYSQAGDV